MLVAVIKRVQPWFSLQPLVGPVILSLGAKSHGRSVQSNFPNATEV